jgi:ParB-like chromosome segregation protein Spo0J
MSIEQPDPFVAATWEPIEAVKVWVRNPRRNDAAAIRIAESLRKSGWCDPLVVAVGPWGEKLVSGHTRLKAAMIIEREAPGTVIRGAPQARMVPVRRQVFEKEAEADRYAVIANASGQLAEWDADLLGEVITGTGLDLTEWGWAKEDVKAIFIEPRKGGDWSGDPDQKPSSERTMVALVMPLSVADFNEVEAALAAYGGIRRDAFMALVRRG